MMDDAILENLVVSAAGGDELAWQRLWASIEVPLSRVIAQHGPNAVAFYLSGQLLTEDYYAANKLMKGFIGSA